MCIYPPTPLGVNQVCDLTAPSYLVSSYPLPKWCFKVVALRLTVTRRASKPMSLSDIHNKSAPDA